MPLHDAHVPLDAPDHVEELGSMAKRSDKLPSYPSTRMQNLEQGLDRFLHFHCMEPTELQAAV